MLKQPEPAKLWFCRAALDKDWMDSVLALTGCQGHRLSRKDPANRAAFVMDGIDEVAQKQGRANSG
jgi:hypothetical protein